MKDLREQHDQAIQQILMEKVGGQAGRHSIPPTTNDTSRFDLLDRIDKRNAGIHGNTSSDTLVTHRVGLDWCGGWVGLDGWGGWVGLGLGG